MYEGYGSVPLHGVRDLVNVNSSLVEEVVEDVVIDQCLLSLLLVAKDEVDPLVEVG